METKNIMIVGVGGQGSLLASKLLGRLLVDEGYDVKVSEVHGMSQRGGSVVTYVRYGEKVYSPIIEEGEADFIVSFEKIEAARWLSCLKKDGKIIVKTIFFRVNHLIQPQRNGVFVSIADNRVDEDEIAPRRDKRGEHRVDDDGFCQRQNNPPKNRQLASSV